MAVVFTELNSSGTELNGSRTEKHTSAKFDRTNECAYQSNFHLDNSISRAAVEFDGGSDYETDFGQVTQNNNTYACTTNLSLHRHTQNNNTYMSTTLTSAKFDGTNECAYQSNCHDKFISSAAVEFDGGSNCEADSVKLHKIITHMPVPQTLVYTHRTITHMCLQL